METRDRITPILVGLVTLVALVFSVRTYIVSKNELKSWDMYLANFDPTVEAYDIDGNEYDLARGQIIAFTNKKETINEKSLNKIILNDTEYYINEKYVAARLEDCVFEKEVWAYRDCFIYEDIETKNIIGEAKKGDKINVLEFNQINSDGTVDFYKFDGGYISGNNVSSDEDYAVNENDSEYAKALRLKTENEHGAGSPSDLDYYPNPKPSFEDNKMPDVCKAIYLNANVLFDIDSYIQVAKECGINTFVIDIKEASTISYQSEVMYEHSPSSYEAALYTSDGFKEIINKCKNEGLYLIGRITTFKDNYLMIDHPEYAIRYWPEYEGGPQTPYLYEWAYWPSPYVRDVWKYNVELAKEAISEYGFNEIQFDYVRFPEHLPKDNEGNLAVDLHNERNETKGQAIQKFLYYATEEIHNVHGYISVDIFGETANDYVTSYGQYLPAISNVVDVISPMPYPDHFEPHTYGIENVVWTVPYELLSKWGQKVNKLQTYIPTPAKIRCYIEGFDATKIPYVIYDNEMVDQQIRGIKDSGVYDGFIIWLSSSNLERYYSFKEAIINN